MERYVVAGKRGHCALELYVFAGRGGLAPWNLTFVGVEGALRFGTLRFCGESGPCPLEPYLFRGRGGLALWNFIYFLWCRGGLALWSVAFSVGGALRFGTLLFCGVEGALCFETLLFSVQGCTCGLEPYFYAVEGSVGFRASLTFALDTLSNIFFLCR